MHQSSRVILAILAAVAAVAFQQASCEPAELTGNLITRKFKLFLEGKDKLSAPIGAELGNQAEMVPTTTVDELIIKMGLNGMESIGERLAQFDDKSSSLNEHPKIKRLATATIEKYLTIWDELPLIKLRPEFGHPIGTLADRVPKFLADPKNQAAAERLRKIYATHKKIQDNFAELLQVYGGDTHSKPHVAAHEKTYEKIERQIEESIELVKNLDPAWEMSVSAPNMLKQLLGARQRLKTTNDFINGDLHW